MQLWLFVNVFFLLVIFPLLMATSKSDNVDKDTASTSSSSSGHEQDGHRLNIILMLIDDMGWYNAPWNGNAEIIARMPYLTNLSTTGLILDRHYSYKYCSPARSSLLSGRLPLHVTQNNNNNYVENPGGADLRMTLLPEHLKQQKHGNNYRTACIGKWHVGARSVDNLPIARGFDYHFGFLKGGEDHFTQENAEYDKGNIIQFVDLFHQHHPAYGRNGTYSTYLYAHEAVKVIKQHAADNAAAELETKQQRQQQEKEQEHKDITKLDKYDEDKKEEERSSPRPLFMYLAWQAMHGPLEAPPEYELPLPNDERLARSKMNAMAAILDEGIANVTQALHDTGLYDNTLLVITSDNGGWIQLDRGGNNYPLRGGKVSDFEGGVRTAAFVTGGYFHKHAPPSLIGTRSNLLLHIVDWYSTIIGLASRNTGTGTQNQSEQPKETKDVVEDDDTVIPPIDSLDFWQALINPDTYTNNNVTAVRKEIPLSFCNKEAQCDYPSSTGDAALISWPWKIVTGAQAGLGVWQGPQFPNSSSPMIPQPGTDIGCPHGCLFNIETDPTEHDNVKEQFPQVFHQLSKRLSEIGQGVYQTNYDGGAKTCLSVTKAYQRDKGFLAPRCSKSGNASASATSARKSER